MPEQPNDKFDEFLNREAKGYRAEGSPPADAIWRRIEGDVERAIRRDERRFTRHWPWIASGAGIAAALVIGIAIGRNSHQPIANGQQPIAKSTLSADSIRDIQGRIATLGHLAQAESFLTEVRADLKTGRNDPHRRERSRELLSRTRLLLANDAAGTPAVDRLLEDLELVLAEIAALPDSGAKRKVDARLLSERLRVGTVIPRIRTVLPSSPITGGEL